MVQPRPVDHWRRNVAVSVFSDESRVVQRVNFITIPPRKRMFQYSLTNLVWCNPVGEGAPAPSATVSVFSDESRVVQPSDIRHHTSQISVSVFSDESRVVQPVFPLGFAYAYQ